LFGTLKVQFLCIVYLKRWTKINARLLWVLWHLTGLARWLEVDLSARPTSVYTYTYTHFVLVYCLSQALKQDRSPHHYGKQRVTACCSVLQRFAAFCSVLQSVGVCWGVLECVGVCRVCWSVLQCVGVCCSVLECVAVCYSSAGCRRVSLQWVAVRH